MAAIAFNAAQRAAGRLEAVLTTVGERVDVFVSYQLRQTAAEAEPGPHSADDELAGSATPFRPLDAGITRGNQQVERCVDVGAIRRDRILD